MHVMLFDLHSDHPARQSRSCRVRCGVMKNRYTPTRPTWRSTLQNAHGWGKLHQERRREPARLIPRRRRSVLRCCAGNPLTAARVAASLSSIFASSTSFTDWACKRQRRTDQVDIHLWSVLKLQKVLKDTCQRAFKGTLAL